MFSAPAVVIAGVINIAGSDGGVHTEAVSAACDNDIDSHARAQLSVVESGNKMVDVSKGLHDLLGCCTLRQVGSFEEAFGIDSLNDVQKLGEGSQPFLCSISADV